MSRQAWLLLAVLSLVIASCPLGKWFQATWRSLDKEGPAMAAVQEHYNSHDVADPDPWGTPLRKVAVPGRDGYLLVSLGPNQTYEGLTFDDVLVMDLTTQPGSPGGSQLVGTEDHPKGHWFARLGLLGTLVRLFSVVALVATGVLALRAPTVPEVSRGESAENRGAE